MKSFLLFLTFCTLSASSIAQTKIKLNTKFKIKLVKRDSINYSFKLISQESFSDTVDISSSYSYIKEKMGKDEIIGIFSKGKLGPTIQMVLLIKNGLPNSIESTFKTKSPGYNLLPTIKVLNSQETSSESWAFPIDYISFTSFTFTPKKTL